MDPEDLRSIIDSGGFEDIAVIQQKRSEIQRITGVDVPYDYGELHGWWDRNKSYISRKVNEQLEDGESKLDVEETDEDVVEGDEENVEVLEDNLELASTDDESDDADTSE